MATFKISKCSSLSFYHNWRTPFEIDQCYLQKFATTDSIRVQYTESSSISLTIKLKNLTMGEVTGITPLVIDNYEQDGIDYTVSVVLLLGLSVGHYSFEFYRYSDLVDRSLFCVQYIENLEKTILISDTNREDNFNAIFTEGEDSFKVFK